MDGQLDGWMDGQLYGCMDGQLDSWMDGQLDGCIDGQLDGWMDSLLFIFQNYCMHMHFMHNIHQSNELLQFLFNFYYFNGKHIY